MNVCFIFSIIITRCGNIIAVSLSVELFLEVTTVVDYLGCYRIQRFG